jgi:hypothetical protein
MDARKKVELIFRYSYYLIGGLAILLIINLMSPTDKSFSSNNQISVYLKEKYDQYIIDTMSIDNFRFIVVESKDKTYYSMRILFSKKGKTYLFEANSNDVIYNKVIYGMGSIEVYKIDNHFIISVGTGELDTNGNPIEISDSDNSDFSILKITDNSLNYYRVYEKLPKSYVVMINKRSFKIN